MKYNLEWYLLRWLVSVAYLVDGLFGTLIFGFWSPDVHLSAEAHFLDYCEKNKDVSEATVDRSDGQRKQAGEIQVPKAPVDRSS